MAEQTETTVPAVRFAAEANAQDIAEATLQRQTFNDSDKDSYFEG
ncbi:hypothetical protein OG462_42100 [Streptomyces sp. NBC_01077]|nr:hypothetical protein OG462_02920 [Streptomyces sp. NBC_01077]WSV43459.1 hypothetical protein OG462_42100 [Streptomyces sp. NBC_01077]